MKFPPFFTTFTIPNGAGSGTSRIVLYSNGALISYDVPDQTYVALFDGQIFMGPMTNPTFGDADFSHAAVMRYLPGSPPSAFIISPPTAALTKSAEIAMTSGQPGGTHATIILASVADLDIALEGDVSIFGSVNMNGNEFISDVYAPNIKAGNVNVTTVANQWVQQAVLFPTPFTAGVPTVMIMGQNGAPGVGGTTILQYAVTSVTTSGFTIGVLRGTAVTMMIGYLATWTPF